jgi:alkaline phosphatase D
VRFTLDGVEPGATHEYSIARAVDGVELARGSFVALDPAGSRARVAFGSCADIDETTARVWSRMALESPDAVVLIGDTPYIDTTELVTQRRRHRMFAGVDSFERLTAGVPLFAVWDDHDFGRNDTDGRLPQREQSRRAFLEYRPLGQAGAGDGGLFHSFRTGPIEVFVLDTRWYARTEPAPGDPSKPSLLGAEQWKWLEAGLRASTAPFKVVASSMVWNSRVRPLKTDCWAAYPHEFERFQDLVRATGAGGVVLVSGDVHRSRVLVHPTAPRAGYDLVELVTSPLHARVHADAAVTGPEVVFDAGVPASFLVLEGRSTAGDESLSARFVTAAGTVFHERVIRASGR